MTDLTSLLPDTGRSSPKRQVTSACGFTEDDRGGVLWHWRESKRYVLRAVPTRLLRRTERGPWRGTTEMPFELSVALRELDNAERVRRGEAKVFDFPESERPMWRAYRVHRRRAVERFFAPVPGVVREAVKVGWTRGSYSLFRFLMTTPAAVDLMASEDGANLAWCLANADQLKGRELVGHTLRQARSQLRRRRRDALAFIGLPATTTALRGLGKVPRAQLGELMPELVRVVNSPTLLARAQTMPVWNGALFLLQERLLPWVTSSLLLEVSTDATQQNQGYSHCTVADLADAIELAAHMNVTIPPIHSRARLTEIHDDLFARTQVLTHFGSVVPFPPPPATLSKREQEWIQPLTTSAALAREGQTMHHCLGNLETQHQRAAAGEYYAFSLFRPERLTLAVAFHPRRGIWVIEDLRSAHNMPADDCAHAIAEELVARFNLGGLPTPWQAPEGKRPLTAPPDGGHDWENHDHHDDYDEPNHDPDWYIDDMPF